MFNRSFFTHISVVMLLAVSSPLVAMEQSRECTVCFDDKNISDLRTLTCSHEFCNNCLTTVLDKALQEKRTTTLRCPNPLCRKAFEQKDIEKITHDKKKLESLGAIQLQEWINQEANTKHCPTADCSYVFINDEQTKNTIQCPQCNAFYCSNCLVEHDIKIACKENEAEENNKLKTDEEKSNDEWKHTNTKPCPQCRVRIEKIDGCDHVKCRNCQYEFCYQCFGIDHHEWNCQRIPQTNNINLVNTIESAEVQRRAQLRQQEENQRIQNERRQREENERRQREENERIQNERRQREENERKQREETERKLKKENEQKLRDEARRKQREENIRKLKEETERRQKEQNEKKQKEETKRKLKEEAERKQKEEIERKLKEQTELRKKEETERKLKEQVNHIARANAFPLSQKMLHRAILDDSAEGVKQAVQIWLDVDGDFNSLASNNLVSKISSNGTPLAFAVTRARPNAVKALLECGFPKNGFIIDEENHKHRIPFIHYAIKQGDIKTALAFIQNGAQFLKGHSACWVLNLVSATLDYIDEAPRLCLEFLEELFNRGFNLQQTNEIEEWRKEYGLRMWSLVIKHPEFDTLDAILDLCIKHGLDPNQAVTDNRHVTPLFIAIEHSNVKAVKFLLNTGADANLKTVDPTSRYQNQTITPLGYAKKTGVHLDAHKEIITLLLENGAKL